jgi:hypothetical protein
MIQILELERKHSAELASLYHRHADAGSSVTPIPSPTDASVKVRCAVAFLGATVCDPRTRLQSFDMIKSLMEQLEAAESSGRQRVSDAEAAHGKQLTAVHERHAAETKALKVHFVNRQCLNVSRARSHVARLLCPRRKR